MPSDDAKVEPMERIAERELCESPRAKAQAIDFMKEWILKNNHIVNVRTDDRFLLRFLRAKKYSLHMCQQALLKWLNLRKTYPQMCKKLDCLDENVKSIIDSGYIYVSPHRDDIGRRVVMYNVQKFDPNLYTCEDMARVHALTYETLLEDEENQVRGVIHVADLRGLSTSHIACWSPETFARLVRWGEQSIPLRHKEIHLLNVPLALKFAYDFAKSMISQKMGSRITLHSTISSLSSKVPLRCLPKEYMGDLVLNEMLSQWKKELLHYRPMIQSLDKMDILSAEGIITSKKTADLNNNNVDTHFKGISGNFRKLDID